jgi:prepilin-type N-terminal cleavage/methylation domain-containing protein
MVRRKNRAFTLIELLVVIGVIAILASILLGVMPAAQGKAVRSRVVTDLKALETAIELYKAKHNFYPPDNPRDHSRPPLFYELTGTTNGVSGGVSGGAGGQPEYRSKAAPTDPPLNPNHLSQIFGIDGFLNNAPAAEGSDVPIFYKSLRPSQIREIETNVDAGPIKFKITFKVLAAPRQGMDGQPAVWHYNKSNPTNNVGEFDLWAEIEFRGEKIVIGNWDK